VADAYDVNLDGTKDYGLTPMPNVIYVDPCNGGFSPQLPGCVGEPPPVTHTVPEPASYMVFGLGLIILMFIRRIRNGSA